ncbi:MAG TPA: excinuclease ABC subunit C [Lentisphaeria bacterium]|nr:excinuclease ABC subunit C [Lentisphaeria bacterium]
MFYVYILNAINYPSKYYVGFTEDLHHRLSTHNSGSVPHTSKFVPWMLITSISFTDKEKALKFEKYLKSHSGRAFMSKHF